MLISELGEFGLIERFRKFIKNDSSVIKGPGDDCAVLKFNQKYYLLFSCDMIIEGIDFLSSDSPYLMGRKSLAINISDIAACGGLPRYALVSLGFPKNKSLKFIERIFKGINDLAKNYKINLVGGDLSRSEKVTIDVSILGIVEKKNLVLRSGAKVGDIIFITGTLGSKADKHLKFIPRLKEARFLVKNFKINAMIDISDGLVQDLSHILKESKKGALIYRDLIPLSSKVKNISDALYKGEEFELIFTVEPQVAREIIKQGLDIFQPIGEIKQKNYGLRLVDKKIRPLKICGFQHF